MSCWLRCYFSGIIWSAWLDCRQCLQSRPFSVCHLSRGSSHSPRRGGVISRFIVHAVAKIRLNKDSNIKALNQIFLRGAILMKCRESAAPFSRFLCVNPTRTTGFELSDPAKVADSYPGYSMLSQLGLNAATPGRSIIRSAFLSPSQSTHRWVPCIIQG